MHDKGSLGFNWLLVIHFCLSFFGDDKRKEFSFISSCIYVAYGSGIQWMILYEES